VEDEGAAGGPRHPQYLDTLTKVGRTPEEERIEQLVGQMRNDAAAQGITLHMDRLLRRTRNGLR